MQGWRFLSRGLPWLLAPAWLFAACGGTVERARDDANATGGAAGTSKGGSRSDQPAGGSTLLPMPVAGRGGTSVVVEGGSGGTPAMLPPGVSDMPKSVSCTPIEHCSSAAIGPVFIDPCCTEEESCGLDTSVLALTGAAFRDRCQAKAQPGVRDTSCPDSAPVAVPFPAGETTVMVPLRGNLGCCRDDGKCGVLVDELSSPVLGVVSKLGLGCVDSAPFFNGMPAADCGSGGESFGGAPNGGSGGDAAAGVSAGGAG
jgi:hypothetical protein